jgi:phosphomannomutase
VPAWLNANILTLITSISGIRGTLGGETGQNLTPPSIVRFVSAFGSIVRERKSRPSVVVGRDGRLSGNVVSALVINTLLMQGIDVIDLELSTTPTVEMAVRRASADAGVIITASHNPGNWNALKFLNENGECISESTGRRLLDLADREEFSYAEIHHLGRQSAMEDAIEWHVDQILQLSVIDVPAIKRLKFHVIADCINSTGALAIPVLLKALGCSYELINADLSSDFAHNPEPLPAHLAELMQKTGESNADLGISVDPDVDRLAFVCDDGSYFGEEYTLVAAALGVLKYKAGPVVSNLSSSMALKDLANQAGVAYHSSPVGEVHVVNTMKEVNAVIGGEGNGGVILPELHYGRDALAGIALVLSYLATERLTLKELRAKLPAYYISKNKANLEKGMDVDGILRAIHNKYSDLNSDTRDGVKIYFEESWVHLRKSNTEPIIRIYAEGKTQEEANSLAEKFREDILELSQEKA